MQLLTREVPDWPPLAWLAECGKEVRLFHGSMAESGDGWSFEGAWAGDFSAGDFDRAAVVTGSGVRVRAEGAAFVSPTSTIDRICHLVTADGKAIVSNSLLALLAWTGSEVTDPKYQARATSIVRGIERNRQAIETSAGRVAWTHFRNLSWDGQRLARVDKPAVDRRLTDFTAYRSFLADSFAELATNASHPGRGAPLTFLGTVSSGYDANAATALAAEAGCRSALAFLTTGRGQPDSGVPVAEALGLESIVLERDGWRGAPPLKDGTEVPFLAAGGGSGLIEFHAAHEHLRGTLLVSGFYGDSIWNPECPDLGPEIVRKDASGLGFCEYRLHAGFVNCAPAFWAAREVADMVGVSNSDEMEPWRLGRGYDRPLPRRIAEEAGVPREVFGHAKRAVPKAQPHRDQRFLTPGPKRDYFDWLRERGDRLGVRGPLWPARDRAEFAWRGIALRLHVALGSIPGLAASRWWRDRRSWLRQRRRRPTALRSHAVAWALDRGKRAYRSTASS